MNDREEFIQAYSAVFLASYAAVSYDMNCARGWPDRSQPVEDAELLAVEAWEQIEKARKLGDIAVGDREEE